MNDDLDDLSPTDSEELDRLLGPDVFFCRFCGEELVGEMVLFNHEKWCGKPDELPKKTLDKDV